MSVFSLDGKPGLTDDSPDIRSAWEAFPTLKIGIVAGRAE
jgi:hypothetical protein